MVRVASDEGVGRRLPQWMLAVPANDQVQRSNHVDDKKKHLEEELHSQAFQTKEKNSIRIRRPRKSAFLQGKEILTEDSRVPECESKKRKSSQVELVQDAGGPDVVPAKKSRRLCKKPLNSGLQQRKRPKNSGSGSSSDIQVQPLSGDDMELTVEDLMIIAKEYVEADENRAREHTFYGERESRSLNQRTSYTKNQSQGSCDSPSTDSKQSSKNYNTSVSHDSTAISDGEKVDIGIRRTGDPAKDMLDLFLGPLLKKSPENEKSTSVTTDVQFSYDLQSQSQRHNDNAGEVVSVTKKKSSLKDKVMTSPDCKESFMMSGIYDLPGGDAGKLSVEFCSKW